MGQGLSQGGLAVGAVFMVAVPIGGFQDQQVAGIGRIRVRENGGVFAAQVSGKGDAGGGAAWAGRERKLDKAGTQNVAGVFHGKENAVFKAEGIVQFKPSGQVIDSGFHGPDPGVHALRNGHGIPEHRGKQGLGGMRADNLPFKPGIDKVRHPAGVVDVGMGEKQIIDGRWRHRPLVKGQHGVMALGNAAVHQEIDTGGLDQVAGAGDAVFGADVGD